MMATMQPTTTGPRTGGSRFFASPPRTPRRNHARPASRSVSRKLAPGFFRSDPVPHARFGTTQAADARPACTVFSYQTASGYTVDPNSLLVGIDGTGSSKWRIDNPDGSSRNSNVANMVHSFKGGAHLYLNGPNTLGTNVRPIANRAVAFIHAQLLANPNMSVNLVGHSRGGLIAIDVTNQLRAGFSDVNGGAPVRVNFLGLFDAVDRAVGMDGSRIGNVDTAFHEIRDPAGGSRSWFGNTGLSADSDVNYTSVVLMGTHSAIGGDPGHGDYQRTHIPLNVEMNTGAQAYQSMIGHAQAAGLPF